MITPPNYEDIPRSARDCKSFGAGHRLHYIQGNRSSGQRAACRIQSINPDGWVTVELLEEDVSEKGGVREVHPAGSVVQCWVHDPVFLSAQLDHFGTADNQISHQWCYLGVANWYPQSFSEEPSPCVTAEPVGDPVKDLETHGGFLLSGSQALAWLARQQSEDPDDPSETVGEGD